MGKWDLDQARNTNYSKFLCRAPRGDGKFASQEFVKWKTGGSKFGSIPVGPVSDARFSTHLPNSVLTAAPDLKDLVKLGLVFAGVTVGLAYSQRHVESMYLLSQDGKCPDGSFLFDKDYCQSWALIFCSSYQWFYLQSVSTRYFWLTLRPRKARSNFCSVSRQKIREGNSWHQHLTLVGAKLLSPRIAIFPTMCR